MTYKFKVGDTGKTRGCLDYRVICVDRGDYAPGEPKEIVALVIMCGKHEEPICYGKAGLYLGKRKHQYDLLPPRQKRKVWVNFYEDGRSYGHPSKETADFKQSGSGLKRIACVEVEIEFTPGEGL